MSTSSSALAAILGFRSLIDAGLAGRSTSSPPPPGKTTISSASAAAAPAESLWFAANPSKRWGEAFFLLYTPFWLTLSLGIVVPYKLYESFGELEYLIIGLVSAVPAFVIPIFLVGKLITTLNSN